MPAVKPVGLPSWAVRVCLAIMALTAMTCGWAGDASVRNADALLVLRVLSYEALRSLSRMSPIRISPTRTTEPSGRCARAARLAWLLLVGLLIAPAARAEDSGVAPGIVVGLVPFELTDPADRCFIEVLLARELEPLGIDVEELPPGTDPELVLQQRPELDYVVAGAVVAGETRSASATVSGRSLAAPQSFTSSATDACQQLAAKVSQLFGQPDTVGRYLQSREQAARDALRDDPLDFEALMVIGMAERFRHNWVRALSFFEQAIEVRPSDSGSKFNKALCHKALGEVGSWRDALIEAQELDPQDPSVGIGLGNYYASTGDVHLAHAQYEKFLETSRVRNLARWNLAVLLARQGKFDGAQGFLEEIPPDSSFFAEARAWSGRIEEAKSETAKPVQTTRERVSLWAQTDLPEGFGVALLVFLLGLVAAAFLPTGKGVEIGSLKIPVLPPGAKKALRWGSPLALVLAVSLYLPLWPFGPLRSAGDAPPLFEDNTELRLAVGAPPAAGR